MKEMVLLNRKEQRRLVVLNQVGMDDDRGISKCRVMYHGGSVVAQPSN
jgi:hypothetical protein